MSDPGVEEEIYDRQSFRNFLDLDIAVDRVPDETTVLNFRRFLEKMSLANPGEGIFTIVSDILQENRIILSCGTLIDATLIKAPTSTKNRSGKRDPEMSSTKKQ